MPIFLSYWFVMDIAQFIFSKFNNIIYKNNVDKIILTIDDVPYDNDSFQNILKELTQSNKCKATFFLISSQVNETNRHLLISAIKNGHHLGNHGKINTIHALCTYEQLHNEIDSCQQCIEELYGEAGVSLPEKKFYRPIVGLVTSTIAKYCDDHNFTIVLGTNYCSDPKISWVWLNEKYVMAHLKQNDIIILHDREWTPELLKRLFVNGVVSHSLVDYVE